VITRAPHRAPRILVAHDVEETRDGIEQLLSSDGYQVDAARDEDDAVEHAKRRTPDLILVSLDCRPLELIARGARIRQRARLREQIPVVLFCIPIVDEGDEVSVGRNVYVTRPDNFDQLRSFIARLLLASTGTA